jgi:hypothetical protein
MHRFTGKTALITGASSGIGAEFARCLARIGCHVILTARRSNQLDVLKNELESLYHIHVAAIPADLSSPRGCEELIHAIDEKKLSVDILLNNAGSGYEGDFIIQDRKKLNDMIALNINALTYLTWHFGKLMQSKKEGYILLTSSIGGLTPCPRMAVYDATKAYVLLFGEALHHELKKHNVVVTTLCPGATRTEFFTVSGQTLKPLVRMTLMSPSKVAQIG